MYLHRAENMRGTVRVPGDKSIAHRALILGSIAKGKHVVEGLPKSGDVLSTIRCLRSLGTFIEEMPDGRVLVLSRPFVSGAALDAGNSGTTARLLAGLLAAHPIVTTIDGDPSLRRRPMARVAEPLGEMGAVLATTEGRLPMTVQGTRLNGISYRLPVPSAQVKSAILIAGIHARGETTVLEPVRTRDHTERLLRAMSVSVSVENGRITVRGAATVQGAEVKVPGDISSAAFFVVAAVCLPGSEVRLPAVGINPTRTGIVSVLTGMGADIELDNQASFLDEPVADVVVRSSKLQGVSVGGDIIPSLIDELPILAVAATQAQGETVVRGAGELRHKESDRIASIVGSLSSLGADIEERPDGFVVRGPSRLRGSTVSSHGDHRIAMAMAVAGLLADGKTEIERSEVVDISYPTFLKDVRSVFR